MLRLQAVAREDGWAFIEEGGTMYLIRPPYQSSNKTLVTQEHCKKAVNFHGFFATDQTFPEWVSLIDHLYNEVNQARKEHASDNPSPDVITKLLTLAPVDQIAKFLDRVESELLPAKEWDHAESLLFALIELRTVKEDQTLFHRATYLLKATYEQKYESTRTRQRDLSAPDSNEIETRFPLAHERYGDALREKAEEVARRHRILEFC